jgi:hypothetical protein
LLPSSRKKASVSGFEQMKSHETIYIMYNGFDKITDLEAGRRVQ